MTSQAERSSFVSLNEPFMKTKIVLITFLLLASSNVMRVQSQVITNGSFENWTNTIYYEDPPPYITTNINTYMQLGYGNVTKNTDHVSGLYSARIETVQLGQDTMFGGLFIGLPGQGGIKGGLPMVVHPDSLSVFAKYNIQTNDTAYIMILFKNNTAIVGVGAFAFAGVQNTFTKYKTAITWYLPVNTDTVAAIITSSRLNPPRYPGSVLYVDDLNFIGDTVPYPNNDFETWNTAGAENPDDWTSINFACYPADLSVTKTTDSYDGTYATSIKNVQLLSGDTMGYLTNGRFGSNGPQGGMQVFQNPEKITGYYKYAPVGPDTALIGCFAYIDDGMGHQVPVDSQMIKLPAASSYTYFEIPFSYNGWPYVDTLNISISSGNLQDTLVPVGLGSKLYVDMLDITYQPVSVPETSDADNNISAYPNPAHNNFSVSFFSAAPEYSIDLFDAKGTLLHHVSLKPTNGYYFYSFDMSGYAKGVYYVKFVSAKKEKTQKIILE